MEKTIRTVLNYVLFAVTFSCMVLGWLSGKLQDPDTAHYYTYLGLGLSFGVPGVALWLAVWNMRRLDVIVFQEEYKAEMERRQREREERASWQTNQYNMNQYEKVYVDLFGTPMQIEEVSTEARPHPVRTGIIIDTD